MISNISDLIRASSTLLWPIIVLIVLLFYKAEIGNLAARLRKAKLFGQEVELDKELDNLQQSAKQLEENAPYTSAPSPEPEQVEPETVDSAATADSERDLLEETARSPKVGLMLVSAEIEREARNLAASLEASAHGNWERRGPMPASLTRNITSLTEMGVLPQGILKSLEQFRAVRSEIVHGGLRVSDDEILRAVDSGLVILRALKAVPRGKFIVRAAGFKVYSDSECKNLRSDVLGVLIDHIGPGGVKLQEWVVPRRENDLHPGDLVTFKFGSPEPHWDESWYRDEVSGKIHSAWGYSIEFAGKVIDSSAP